MVHHRRDTCRGCGKTKLSRFLELGNQPLANAFLRPGDDFESEGFYPLDVYYCHGCSLVQLLDVIDPEVLFSNYIYVTGTSETIAAHNVAYARAVVERLDLGADDRVVEVASNDGSLLKCFQAEGTKTLGIEPAKNIAKMAEDAGVPTVNEFFSLETAMKVRESHGAAKVVIGNNVLAHVDDTIDFLSGAAFLIEDDGRVIVEFPYLGELMDRFEYDTVYHEHLCYFSVTAVARVFERAGMSVVHIDKVPVHGGSLRVWGAKRSGFAGHTPEVQAWFEREKNAGLVDFKRFEKFGADVARQREQLNELLARLKAKGHTIAAYGAPAKGNTMLNYCGIGTDVVPFTVDRSPLKVGYLTPGMHIPVLDAVQLAKRRPDYTLILAWNFADEIIRQQAAYTSAGGRFIVPIPEPRIV